MNDRSGNRITGEKHDKECKARPGETQLRHCSQEAQEELHRPEMKY